MEAPISLDGVQSIRIVDVSACVIFILHQKIQKMVKYTFWYQLTWVVLDKVQRAVKWLCVYHVHFSLCGFAVNKHWILSISSFVVYADSAREVGYFGSGMTVLSCWTNSSRMSMLQSQKLCQRIRWSILSMKNLDIRASGQNCEDWMICCSIQTAWHVQSWAIHHVPLLICVTSEKLQFCT